jgi:hypothetical protein
MGDKDTNMLFGNCAIFIGKSEADMKSLGKVVENSTRLNPEDAAELDRLSVREKMQVESLHIKPISFDCDVPIGNMPAIIGFDEALEPSRCSLIIQSEPKINKPKNLKYPNKKRARRIWKKWKRRFGTTSGESIYLPDVESRIEGDNVIFTAKPIKND